MKRVLMVGATSAIAQETARLFAAEGNHLVLIGRNQEQLQIITTDLKTRGARKVEWLVHELNDLKNHELLLEKAIEKLGGLDIVLIAHGTLGNQSDSEKSVIDTLQEVQTNLLSPMSLLTLLANFFEQQQSGCIAVITSVAGDRGRKSNYVYGTAKGGLSIFLEGLRNRLHKSGVYVLTIKPGPVDTPMTKHLPKNMLWAHPEDVAKAIHSGITHRKDVIYVPWYWWGIMKAIKTIPEKVFKILKL